MFKPRPSQAQILNYEYGKMGVAAVPGSGKTHTLSYLASQLITKGLINDQQEILIVTLVNSAVDNFSSRISGFIQEAGLLPHVGYRVRTLHGLAHDIVRERPELANLSDRFSIIDESESSRMIEQASVAYLRQHPEIEPLLLDPSADLRTDSNTKKKWNELIASVNTNFISQAKDYELEPTDLLDRMQKFKVDDPILNMAVEVYSEYQRGLRYRGSVDFSDLIRLAHRVLLSDNDFLERLRYRWPYILEDEAQDSSELQEHILRLLVGESGNWVRVGDTNQAIYETFTTANPKFLQAFLEEDEVIARDLPNSGRSNISIINLANTLNDWTRTSHPVEELKSSLCTPHIQPTPKDDPQPNPADHAQSIFIMKQALTSEQEIEKVVSSIKSWLPNNLDKTVAILCPTGFHAEKFVETLEDADIEVVEMLKSTQSTRRVTRLLEKILHTLSEPTNPNKLVNALNLMVQGDSDFPNQEENYGHLINQVKHIKRLEDFFYPTGESDWMKQIEIDTIPPRLIEVLNACRKFLIHWQNAAPLPIDQLLITIGRDLFTAPQDLALTHKIALMLEYAASLHPEYQLQEFALELGEIASNERKFSGFSEDDTGFNPEAHKGKVLVTTFHKAKGLEWDRVYLTSVNNYDFPSAQEFDQYIGEKWFIKGKLNIEAETLAKLEALARQDIPGMFVEPGQATMKARIKYSAERLRLLYVGITRARHSLIITWNTGRRKEALMALSLEALNSIREIKNASA